MRKSFSKVIKTVIENVKKQYAIPVYDFKNIRFVKDDGIVFSISDQLFLETLLMEINVFHIPLLNKSLYTTKGTSFSQ